MKSKIVTTVLMLILLWCGMTFLWAPSSTAINVWDKISSKQSDLMYKYNSFYTDLTKYWNPMSTINQNYYPTISDLTYKYRSSYTDPAKYWNPMSTINQSHYSTMSDLTYKYRSSYADPAKYWNPMSAINQRSYPTMSDLAYKYTMPSMNLSKYWNPVSAINQPYYRTASDLAYKYTSPTKNAIPSDLTSKYIGTPLSVSALPRVAPKYPDIISPIEKLLINKYGGFLSSHFAKESAIRLTYEPGWTNIVGGTATLVSTVSRFIPDVVTEVNESRRMNRPFGSSIQFWEGIREPLYITLLSLLGGPVCELAGIATADVSRYVGARLDSPYSEWWKPQSQFEYNKWTPPEILQNRWAYDMVLGIPRPPEAAPYTEVFRHFQDYIYQQNPYNFAQDINLSQINTSPIKPVDLSALSPQTQKLFRDYLIGNGTALSQFNNYLSSQQTPILDNWLSQMCRTPSISALQPSSSFYSWSNSLFGFGNSWSYTSLLSHNDYSSFSSNQYNYNYGSGWR